MWDTYNWDVKNSQIKTKKSKQTNIENNISIIELEKEVKKVKFWIPIISWIIAIVTGLFTSIIYDLWIKNLFTN